MSQKSIFKLRHIRNPIRDLRWSVLLKYLTGKSRQLFSQIAPSQMFDRVLNTPLSTVSMSQYQRSNQDLTKHQSQDILPNFWRLTFFAKRSIMNNWQDPKYIFQYLANVIFSGIDHCYHCVGLLAFNAFEIKISMTPTFN